jgi:hypothetical protein
MTALEEKIDFSKPAGYTLDYNQLDQRYDEQRYGNSIYRPPCISGGGRGGNSPLTVNCM